MMDIIVFTQPFGKVFSISLMEIYVMLLAIKTIIVAATIQLDLGFQAT